VGGGDAESLTVLTGVTLGVLVSLTSVGGGALGVTALVLLYPTVPLARVRYRACCTTHPARRRRPLDRRNGERHDLALSADGLAAWGHRGQPRRRVGARAWVAIDLGDGADRRRGGAGLVRIPGTASRRASIR
jgi:hypothetical protein